MSMDELDDRDLARLGATSKALPPDYGKGSTSVRRWIGASETTRDGGSSVRRHAKGRHGDQVAARRCRSCILAGMYLPAPLQLAAANALSWRAMRSFPRRTEQLPPRGPEAAVHLTSVLRVSDLDVPELGISARHYRYSSGELHMTVANLDTATEPLDRAVARLHDRDLDLPAVSVRLCRVTCSPDTLFIHCVVSRTLARLQSSVRDAFGVPPPRSPVSLLTTSLAHVNVARFDGRGERPPQRHLFDMEVTMRQLEIVRTDRYLSGEGTDVLAKIDLRTEGQL
jgi:hypothetical protein